MQNKTYKHSREYWREFCKKHTIKEIAKARRSSYQAAWRFVNFYGFAYKYIKTVGRLGALNVEKIREAAKTKTGKEIGLEFFEGNSEQSKYAQAYAFMRKHAIDYVRLR